MRTYVEHLPQDITERVNLKEILRQPFQHLAELEEKLTVLFPQLAQGKVDDPFKTTSQTAPQVPPPVSFTVTQKAGLSFVNIELPQLQNPPTAALYALLVKRGQNPSLSPLYHKVQSALSGSFDSAAGTVEYDLGIGVWTLPDANPQWRIKSSFDTLNYNDFSVPRAAVLLP